MIYRKRTMGTNLFFCEFFEDDYCHHEHFFWYVLSISLLQNQLDSFQFLTIVTLSYALAVYFTSCHIRYTTKWVKLESILDKTSFNSSKSHFLPSTLLYFQEEWCWEFWKTINLIKSKSQMTSDIKTRSRQLVKLLAKWRIKE